MTLVSCYLSWRQETEMATAHTLTNKWPGSSQWLFSWAPPSTLGHNWPKHDIIFKPSSGSDQPVWWQSLFVRCVSDGRFNAGQHGYLAQMLRVSKARAVGLEIKVSLTITAVNSLTAVQCDPGYSHFAEFIFNSQQCENFILKFYPAKWPKGYDDSYWSNTASRGS